jgi:hypothetical protein
MHSGNSHTGVHRMGVGERFLEDGNASVKALGHDVSIESAERCVYVCMYVCMYVWWLCVDRIC